LYLVALAEEGDVVLRVHSGSLLFWL
jgi:hypothetical protein